MSQRQEKLSKDPIIEAIFEIRFEPKDLQSSHMFAGLVYSNLRDRYPLVENLNIVQLPLEIRQNDPNLRYSVEQRFRGHESYLVSAGPRVLAVACPRPYQHWEGFKPRIVTVVELLGSLDYVGKIERVGLRYINFLGCGGDQKEQFSQLRFTGKLSGHDLTNYMTQVRTEIPSGKYVSAVNIACNAKPDHPDFRDKIGLLFDIDTFCHDVPQNFLEDCESILEEVHDLEGDTFFSSLTEKTLAGLR